MSEMNYKVAKSKRLSAIMGDDRWVIVQADTNEILDNAQGYGYTSPNKACAAYQYKNFEPSTKVCAGALDKYIRYFILNNESLLNALDDLSTFRSDGTYHGVCIANDVIDNIVATRAKPLGYWKDDILRVWDKMVEEGYHNT